MLRRVSAIKPTLTRMLAIAAPVIALGFVANAAAGDNKKPNPYAMADETWITISGEVEAVNRDRFTLDYGDGLVIVEMDDGDRDADAYKLLKGDKVTVSGRIDDDFFEATKIEASSVFVENLGTTFFASSVDEETSEGLFAIVSVPVEMAKTSIQGTVTDVDAYEFSVDAGVADVRVDINEMPYNPLDDKGYQKIDVGDRVRVSGNIDIDLFEGQELVADSVIKLNR